mgnify:CR=1 FL=1
MANLDKKNAIYIEGVVIANGVQDTYGDILTKEDINKLMTSYVDKTVDTNHSFLEENGVSIVKNYTTEKAKKIHGQDVPVGSWVAELMIWNEDIIKNVHTHKFNGLSLASVPNKLEDIKAFLNQEDVNYRDFNDMDDLTPLMISLVKKAGNGYDFDVYPYDVYVKREMKTEDKNMTDENTDMASVMKEMLSIIARSADQTPINGQSYNERFNAMDEKINGLEEKFDVKLDEKLNAFLEKLDEQNKAKQPEPKEPEPSKEPEPKEPKEPEPKKTKKDGKKQKTKEPKEPPVSVTRNAPITNGVENNEPFEYKTFECPEPKVKRDYFGRPIR